MSETVLKPVSEPVRRLEIFTGAGRRRAWSADQKAAIVAESLSRFSRPPLTASQNDHQKMVLCNLNVLPYPLHASYADGRQNEGRNYEIGN